MSPETRPQPTELLQRVAAGDAAAVDELMARYLPLVWSIVRGRVSDDSAEDVVQEVFIQLWRNAERFDPAIASESTFISVIARRRLVDRQRREHVRRTTEHVPEELAEEIEHFERVDLRDEAEHAERALARIRPEEREVLHMSISGLSHREIARRSGTPLGTVKSQARRGLERVRRLLEEESSTAAKGRSSEARDG